MDEENVRRSCQNTTEMQIEICAAGTEESLQQMLKTQARQKLEFSTSKNKQAFAELMKATDDLQRSRFTTSERSVFSKANLESPTGRS